MSLCRIILLIVFVWLTPGASAQYDSSRLKRLYDKCLDFDESKLDSISWYATLIQNEAAAINFKPGKVLSLRLKGIHSELSEEYEEALSFYLSSLDEARILKNSNYESAALSDLAILYSRIKQPQKAKEVSLKSLKIALDRKEVNTLITNYGNLGAIYNQLNRFDSAHYFLSRALKLSQKIDNFDLSILHNNLGNVYFKTSNFDSALYYFRINLEKHNLEKNESSLWLDYLNIADAFIEKQKPDSAKIYLDKSLATAISLGSKSKEADTYSLFAKFYEKKKQYNKAFEYQKKWYAIDTSLINSETNKRVADLQERYNAHKRDSDNKLLKTELATNKLRQKSIGLLALALTIIATLTGFAWFIKRRANQQLSATNELILRQNEKLAALNQEKNALISIVSHDLSSPFVNIMMWGQLLQTNKESLSEHQQVSIERMISSANQGEKLIRTILNVERAETNNHLLKIEPVELNFLINHVLGHFLPRADAKKINIHVKLPSAPVEIISDAHIIERILENLLSNALKFSYPGSNVYIQLTSENNEQIITIRDEGIGISKEELPNLFNKYSKISNAPTGGEHSTGLGLSIVKRLTDELHGRIECESIKGEGTTFRVYLY